MKEFTKSVVSFSWAMGIASVRGVGAMIHKDQRQRFFKDTESMLNNATQTTINTLGRNLRETYQFGDDIQRRGVDSGMRVIDSIIPNRKKDS
jgi:hypothetical protein